MKQGQRLNPFSVADTDKIIRFVRADQLSDEQIVGRMKMLGRDITVEEVRRICAEAGKFVRFSDSYQ